MPINTTVVTVAGMTCAHCVAAVTDEISKLAGVDDVAVDLASGQVTIRSTEPLTAAGIEAAVDEAGYEISG